MISPLGTRRLRNETTWWETSTSPQLSRHWPQAACSFSAAILISVCSRAMVEYGGEAGSIVATLSPRSR